jgi:hypothetical protein
MQHIDDLLDGLVERVCDGGMTFGEFRELI